MDPNVTLARFYEAYEAASADQHGNPAHVNELLWTAVESAHDLIVWLTKGGFAPMWKRP